jgi:hypothetical protein
MLATQNSKKPHTQNQNLQYSDPPKTQKELESRVEHAKTLLTAANNLKISGASSDKVNEAYQRADEAQKGLFYHQGNREAEKLLKKDKTFCFDEETGVVICSQKHAKNYRIGQKLPIDRKTGEAFVEITQIKALSKEEMKEFKRQMIELHKPRLVPLFNIKEEQLAIESLKETKVTQIENVQKPEHKIQPQNQEKELEKERKLKEAEERLVNIRAVKAKALEIKAKREAEKAALEESGK